MIGRENFQRTLGQEVSLSAESLIRKKRIEIMLSPAGPNDGISIVRSDHDGKFVNVCLENVTNTFRWITISGEISVSIIEHICAALLIAGIDNAIITINDRFFPSLPESILPFLEKIKEVGIRSQEVKSRQWRVVSPGLFKKDDRWVAVMPADKLEISYTIDFPNPIIGRQTFVLANIDFAACVREIARARAFNVLPLVPDFILNRMTPNFVLVSGNEFLNKGEDAVRYGGSEPVRHKIVDLLGALALLGGRVEGRFSAFKSGHTIDVAALRYFIAKGILVAD